MKDKEKIEKIAREVEEEYKIGGLSEGIYLDFATDVAIRYEKEEREKTIEEILEIGDEIDGENNSNTWRKIFNKLITLK